MKFLLDTSIALWNVTADRRLNSRVLELLHSSEAARFLSSASTWEIAIKHALGGISLHEEPAKLVPLLITEMGLQTVDITQGHAIEAGRLPMHHRDPFDRMLIAQARMEGLTLLTADRNFRKYDVPQIFCGR